MTKQQYLSIPKGQRLRAFEDFKRLERWARRRHVIENRLVQTQGGHISRLAPRHGVSA